MLGEQVWHRDGKDGRQTFLWHLEIGGMMAHSFGEHFCVHDVFREVGHTVFVDNGDFGVLFCDKLNFSRHPWLLSRYVAHFVEIGISDIAAVEVDGKHPSL